jgi:hypothetical protein
MAENTQNKDLLEILNSRLTLSRKWAEDYRKDVKDSLESYEIKSFDKLDYPDLHNRLQIPYIFSTIETGIPSMFENVPSIHIEMGGKRDKEFTDFVQPVWDYIQRLTNLDLEIEDVGFTSMLTGLGTLNYGWETETSTVKETVPTPMMDEFGQPIMDERGQPQIQEIEKEREVIIKDQPFVKYLKYNRVYFSPESMFTIDDESNVKIPYVIIEEVLPKDSVEYYYNKKVEESELVDIDEIDKDLDEKDLDRQGIQESDLERVRIYHYYGLLPKKGLSDWRPTNVYHAVFTKKDILVKPEITTKKPVLALGNYGSPDRFWRFGDAKVLSELEKDISLGRSIMSDYRDRLATKVAVPYDTEFDEDSFRSPKSFTLVKFIGDKYPQYITPPPVPEVVMNAMNMTREDIQMASAQLDISRGGTSSTIDTATGQKIFAAVHERRIERKRRKMGYLIKSLAKNLLVLAGEKWGIEVFARITDLDPQLIQERGFIEKLADIGTEYDVVIEVEDVINNKEARSAQAIALWREMKEHPLVNQEELIRFVIRVGFNQKDVDRFVNMVLTPEMLLKAIEELVKVGLLPPEQATMIAETLASLNEGGQMGPVGRPQVAPTGEVIQNAMPGTDSTQI